MTTFAFPGQGSQFVGMGADLFRAYPKLTQAANDILQFKVDDLCSGRSPLSLTDTQYTQPAIFVVSVLAYLQRVEQMRVTPDYVLGHSLGELTALFAASALEFEAGIQLVKKRGELMSQARAGGMAAVLGLDVHTVEGLLREHGLTELCVANHNTQEQCVLSGTRDAIQSAGDVFRAAGAKSYVPLPVSGAFHSVLMKPAEEAFRRHLAGISLAPLTIPVISNVHARPYEPSQVKETLARQLTSRVRWVESILYLLDRGETRFEEVGPGTVLTRIIDEIRKARPDGATARSARLPAGAGRAGGDGITAASLGSDEFKADYGLKLAYASGSMYRGIASKELVARMAKSGLLGFFGAGGLDLKRVEEAIVYLKESLRNGETFGMNLLNNLRDPTREEATVDLYLKHGVTLIEASAYMKVSAALVRYRLKGLRQREGGEIERRNRIIAKVSRPEVASQFLQPAPAAIVNALLEQGKVSREEAECAKSVPMADDLCVEADSAGHTDHGNAYALLPVILRMRDEAMRVHGYAKTIRVGGAGGIGSPEATAATFVLGGDFVLTGSINQCTVEAGTSEAVKNLLQAAEVQDTDYAPAGDMFELGAQVQVLRRGVLFPARANRLSDLYHRYASIDDVDAAARKQIEQKYFKCSIADVYERCRAFFGPTSAEIHKAERDPKHRMALIFRWYFGMSNEWAISGVPDRIADYQVHCGPALGSFNRWVLGTALEDWRARHPDAIGVQLMEGAADFLERRFRRLAKAS
jgi:trans-AT polyketide synthase/acyltransferase/oxidoreductase domain-containing protein